MFARACFKIGKTPSFSRYLTKTSPECIVISSVSIRSNVAPRQYSSTRQTATSAAQPYTKSGLIFVLLLAFPVGYFCGERRLLGWNDTGRHTSAQLAVEPTNDSSTAPLKKTPLPYHDISAANLNAAKQEIEKFLGKDGIDDRISSRQSRASSPWSAAPPGSIAEFVCFPSSTDDVSNIVRICHRRRIPIPAYSGGTSLEGALASTRGGICIDFQKMNKVLAIHKDDMDVVVQPAVGWEGLNEQLATDGLFFPPDPGPGAQIGGMIGTGCSGTNAYRYGTMKDWVISLTVVLADGTVVQTKNRPRKSSAGYDLTRLLVGSSGTLGLVTEATLKLTNVQENVCVAVIPFASTGSAVRMVGKVIRSGLQLAAVELLDDVFMRAINTTGSTTQKWKECPTLFVKFAGLPAATQEQMKLVKLWAKEEGLSGIQMTSDPAQVDMLWQARKVAMFSLIATKRHPDDKFLTADPAVPMSRLAEIIDESRAMIDEAGLYGSNLGHVGDGNYHVGVFYSGDDEEAKARKLILDVEKRTVELEGSVSGEHNIGLERRAALRLELGEEAVDMMRKIKLALDPHCLLNCDKILEMPESERKLE